MKEIWKDIKEYEGIYQVSNQGRIKSLERIVANNKKGKIYYRKVKECILTPSPLSDGYLVVSLHKDLKMKNFKIHRLVALSFLENPNGYLQVDHINTIKSDNRVENLRWCTSKQNHNNGLTLINHKRATLDKIQRFKGKYIERLSKPVRQYDLNLNLIREFSSISEAAKTFNISSTTMQRNCKGKQRTAGNYIWKYAYSTQSETSS